MRSHFLIPCFTLLLLGGCSTEDMLKFTMTKALQLSAEELCDGEQACLDAIEQQMESCIEQSPTFQEMLKNNLEGDNESQGEAVAMEAIVCIVDADGNPYFDFNTEELVAEEANDAPPQSLGR